MAVPPQFPTTTFTPTVGTSIILGSGGSSGQAQKKILCIGCGIAAGTMSGGDIDEVYSGDEADTYYGAGSPLARMCRAVFAQERGVRVFGGFVDELGAGTAAQVTVTFAAGPQAGAGNYSLTIMGWTIFVSIPDGTAANPTAAALLNAAIQAHPYYAQMPFASTTALGAVTLTAKYKGIQINDICDAIRDDSSGLTTLTATLNTAAVPGAGVALIATILTNSATDLYDYYVLENTDSASGILLEAHLDTYVAPLKGLRQQGIFVSQDTPANAVTCSQAINAHLIQVGNAEMWETPGHELAAMWAAERAYREATDPATPYKGYPLKHAMPPFLMADRILDTEIETCLHGGVTPLEWSNGDSKIVRSITSRSLTSGGAPDSSVLDTMHVAIAFACADNIETDFETYFMKEAGIAFKLMDDPAAGILPPSFTATPKLIKDRAVRWLWTWYDNGWLQDQSTAQYEVSCSIDAVDDTRANLSLPLYTIRGFMVADIAIFQK